VNKEREELEQLKTVYHNYTDTLNIKDSEKSYIGHVHPYQDPNFIAYFMTWWVGMMDIRLDKVAPYSNQYADILGHRGITINELKLVLSGKQPLSYFEERAYEYLYITDKQEHDYFISLHSYDEEKDLYDNFLDVMTVSIKNEIPLLHEFFFGSKIRLYFPLSSLRRHTYILGKSGKGKSEIIKNLWYDLQKQSHIKHNKTLIALEPSGKLIKELLQLHLNAEDSKRVVYLDTNIRLTAQQLLGEDIFKEDYTFVLNPFQLKNKHDINYMTTTISDAIFELMTEEAKKGQMPNVLNACIDLLLSMDNTDFLDLRDLNDEDEEMEKKYIEAIAKMDNEARKGLLQNKFNSKKYGVSKNGIYNRVHQIIEDRLLSNVFNGQSTVDLEKEMNSGKVILFNSTSLSESSIKVFGKLVVCLIKGYITKRKDSFNTHPKPTFLFIDEVQNYITESLSTIMGESRKFGLHMILANQVYKQKMSTQMADMIMGNTAIKVASRNNDKTEREMAKEMGMKVADFKKLPKYHFYIFDDSNEKAGHRMFKASSNFVKVKAPYFMDQKALKEFFLWTVHESGYYRKVGELKPTITPNEIDTFKPIWSKE